MIVDWIPRTIYLKSSSSVLNEVSNNCVKFQTSFAINTRTSSEYVAMSFNRERRSSRRYIRRKSSAGNRRIQRFRMALFRPYTIYTSHTYTSEKLNQFQNKREPENFLALTHADRRKGSCITRRKETENRSLGIRLKRNPSCLVHNWVHYIHFPPYNRNTTKYYCT